MAMGTFTVKEDVSKSYLLCHISAGLYLALWNLYIWSTIIIHFHWFLILDNLLPLTETSWQIECTKTYFWFGYPAQFFLKIHPYVCDKTYSHFSPSIDLLYLGTKTVQLPFFTPITYCTTSPNPVKELGGVVTGLVQGKVFTFGGIL